MILKPHLLRSLSLNLSVRPQSFCKRPMVTVLLASTLQRVHLTRATLWLLKRDTGFQGSRSQIDAEVVPSKPKLIVIMLSTLQLLVLLWLVYSFCCPLHAQTLLKDMEPYSSSSKAYDIPYKPSCFAVIRPGKVFSEFPPPPSHSRPHWILPTYPQNPSRASIPFLYTLKPQR